MSAVKERLEALREEMRAVAREAGRAPDSVRLVLVSKLQPLERVREAYEAGQRDFGENYVQALIERRQALPGDVRWHLIGHLQSNKARLAAANASLVHTVDSARLAEKLDHEVHGAPLPVLLEVNVGGEDSKAGVAPAGVEALAGAVARLPHLELCGLMCIPPPGEGRAHFAALRALRDRLEGALGRALPELSMGMSADYADAIREGATLIRVGTKVFGERVVPPGA